MKRWIFIWTLALTLIEAAGQEINEHAPSTNGAVATTELSQFLSISGSEEDSALIHKFDRLIKKLEKIQDRRNSDYAFLKSIFYKTHTSLLNEYDRLATMDQTLQKGKFGCLTGTALYAIILEHFGYEYQIIELPNHVFIHLTLDEKSYVFESTLPSEGFMKTSVEMEQLLKQPWLSSRRISELTTVGNWFEDFKDLPNQYTTINLQQLAGLQYFNESAKHYLNKDYAVAMDMVLKAYELYPSERNEKLMQLIINKILKYDLIKEELKNQYLERYVSSIKGKKISQTK